MVDFNAQIKAVTDEIAALEDARIKALIELGEQALPELKSKVDYFEPVSRIEEAIAKIEDLKERKKTLEAEKAKFEREEKERAIMRSCTRCGRINPDGAKFCEGCGAQIGVLPREYCKVCTTMNPPTLKFCGECGNKLDDAPGPR